MRIVTNPGSDLTPALVDRYQIDMTPQQVVVEGVLHDTRDGIEATTVDAWVANAAEHPYVLGTSAAEFAGFFSRLGREDPSLLAIMTSRKLIQSYDAAVSASHTLARQNKRPLDVQVVDTGVTSIGAGLATLLAAVAREHATISLKSTRLLVERFCAGLDMKFCVSTMGYLVKGGRASALRAWMADLLGVRPLLALEEGEIVIAGRLSTKSDPVAALADSAASRRGRRRLWAAVAHGNAPELGERLAATLRERLNLAFVYVVPFSAAIYLHAGPGSVGYCTGTVDDLGWEPPAPVLAP